MGKIVNNEIELRKQVLQSLEPVLKYVMNQIYIDGQKALTISVYQAGRPHVYNRTYEFLNAWDVSVHTYQNKSVDIEGMYFYAPSKIHTLSKENGQHLSVVDGSDIREALADIIFLGKAGKIFGTGFWTKRRNSMKELFNYIGKQRLAKYIEDGLKESNIKYERHGYPTLVSK